MTISHQHFQESFMRKIKIAIFIAALIIGLVFAKVFGAVLGIGMPNMNFSFSNRVKGSGVAKIEKRELSGFKKIDVSGALNIEITAQKDFSIEVESDDNLIEHIITEVSGDTLNIYTKKGIKPYTKTRVLISMPELTGAEISGVSKIIATNVKTDLLDLNISGASKVEVSGQANKLNVNANGASKINAEGLKVENANLDLSGATKVTVFATEELKAEASGASKIYYVGEPKNIIKDISGAGKIQQK